MKTSSLRPGSCLWVIGLLAWPALVAAIHPAVDPSALDAPTPAVVETDETPDAPVAPTRMPALRPFDEGWAVDVQ